MTTFKFKLLAAAAMVATLAGGLGTGVYFAQAEGNPQAKAKPDATAPPAKPAAGIGSADGSGEAVRVEFTAKAPGTTASTTAILNKNAGFESPLNVTIGDLFEQLSKEHGATFRIENVQGLKVMGIDNPYEKTVELRFTKGLSVQDILDEVVNTLTPNDKTLGFRVKGNQVLLGKVFVPPTMPSAFDRGDSQMPHAIMPDDVNKMLYGPTVSLSVKDKTLKEIVDLLREQTGANIVLNEQGLGDEIRDRKLTLTMNDTKLFTVLKVASDMCDLAPATVDNVFYVTNPEKAGVMNRETAKALFGEAAANQSVVPDGGNAKPAGKPETKNPE